MLDAGCWMLDAGCWILDTGYWILDTGCWILDAGCWMLQPIPFWYPPFSKFDNSQFDNSEIFFHLQPSTFSLPPGKL
ncbi:MAG: hypothetical protein JEZ11_18155 [Desulfobacterales bacterium]|nr:hypothetical protein [Desulfobacterales bacterium]